MKLFHLLVLLALAVLPRTGFSAPPDGKPRVLIARLGRGQLNQLWLDVTVENVKGAMMVDTGAEATSLNRDKYGFLLRGPERRLPPGVAPTTRVNSMTVPVALARDFRLGGNALGGAVVTLVPDRYLSDGEAFHYQDRKGDFDGLMGEDFLRSYRAVIDCHRQLLYLNLGPARQDNLATILPANGFTRVPMSNEGSDFTVPCALNGHRFRLIVDTGAPFTLVDKELIYATGLHSRDLPMSTGIIGDDSAPAEVARVSSFQIGDYTANDVHVTTAERLRRGLVANPGKGGDLPVIGLLGGDTLGFNGAIIDVGGHALYLKHP